MAGLIYAHNLIKIDFVDNKENEEWFICTATDKSHYWMIDEFIKDNTIFVNFICINCWKQYFPLIKKVLL